MSLTQPYCLSEQPFTVSDLPMRFPRNWRPPTRRGSTLSEVNSTPNSSFPDYNLVKTSTLSKSSSGYSTHSIPSSLKDSETVVDNVDYSSLKDEKSGIIVSSKNCSPSGSYTLLNSILSESNPLKSSTSVDQNLVKNSALLALNPEKNSISEENTTPLNSKPENKFALSDLTSVINEPRLSSSDSRRRPTLTRTMTQPPLRRETRTWKDVTQAALLQARLQKRR